MENKIKFNLREQTKLYEHLESCIVEGFGFDIYIERMNLEKSEETQKLIKERNEVQERLYKILGVER